MKKENIIDKAVEKLEKSDLVHSIILFGSVARGEERKDSDIDLCIVEDRDENIELDDKLKLKRDLPKKVEISFFHDLPMDIRGRVFKEGEVLYTKDKYYLLELIKVTSFELPYYIRKKKEYHEKAMERAKTEANKQ